MVPIAGQIRRRSPVQSVASDGRVEGTAASRGTETGLQPVTGITSTPTATRPRLLPWWPWGRGSLAPSSAACQLPQDTRNLIADASRMLTNRGGPWPYTGRRLPAHVPNGHRALTPALWDTLGGSRHLTFLLFVWMSQIRQLGVRFSKCEYRT